MPLDVEKSVTTVSRGNVKYRSVHEHHRGYGRVD